MFRGIHTDRANKEEEGDVREGSTHTSRFRIGNILAIALPILCLIIAIIVYFYFKYSTGMFLF